MNAESITSSPTRTRWMVSSAGNRVPSLRFSSTSTCITFSGSGAAISCLIRSSCSARPCSGKIRLRSGLPIASAAGQPNRRSAAVFQAVTSACAAVDRHERVGRGVEEEPDAGLALAQLARARLRGGGLAPDPASRRAIRSPVTAGVPTASGQRSSGPSWITSTTA